MKKFTIQKEEGIIDGSWRTGWTVYEKIGEIWGKEPMKSYPPWDSTEPEKKPKIA